ncbi:MAG: 50S ribosomal protein L25 [Actinobacteria bacterium]|nr:50S ribosomal protein L25 [Actinomycetota bacterium]MBW3643724.1 50S ribosomal protein L25 [Actinomycetota bacterium]
MAEVALRAESGRPLGSRASRRLRAEGKIPAVLYGHGAEPRSLAVVRRELRQALTTEAGTNAVIDLEVDGAQHLTIVRDIQRDPVRNQVTHVDFILVSRDEVMTVEVPVVLSGVAEEVKREGGTVDQVLFTLTVSATPGRIPNELVIDVADMVIGDTIRVGDVAVPGGVTIDVDPEEPVVTATVSHVALEVDELAADVDEGEGEGEGAAEDAAG